MEDSVIGFHGNDPGAVRFGNFINYYAFHPAKQRIDLFPKDVWEVERDFPPSLACLDIGCNSGELTLELFRWMSEHIKREGGDHPPKLTMLGVDLDKTLILRANEISAQPNIKFSCLDIMNFEDDFFQKYLLSLSTTCFGAVFIMSVTMWVHLSHGDDGLRQLLLRCAKLSSHWLVIETQPWSCYRNAQRRLIRSGAQGFPLFPSLSVRGADVEDFIQQILVQEGGMCKIYETEPSKWNRRTLFFQKNKSMK